MWDSLSDKGFREANPGKEPDHGKFIGMEQWTGGFDPVFVKWECRADWCSGQDELFYHPSVLHADHYTVGAAEAARHGGVEAPRGTGCDGSAEADGVWVPIEKLCWVLDPVQLFSRVMLDKSGAPTASGGAANVTPLKDAWWMVAADKLRSDGRPDPKMLDGAPAQSFAAQQQLVLYYEAQIDLFAEMCLDRSYNAITELCRHFSYPELTSLVVNERLPDQIRASFTKLLLRLYIDRFPHGRLSAPNPIQVLATIAMPDLESRSALPQFEVDPDGPLAHHTDPFFAFGVDPSETPANKFHLIEDFISDYMIALDGCQVAKDKEKNIFTLAVLSMLEKLVAFGFYGTRHEVCARARDRSSDAAAAARKDLASFSQRSQRPRRTHPSARSSTSATR